MLCERPLGEWSVYKNDKLWHSINVLLVRVEICCITFCWSPTKLSINVSLPLGKQPGSRPYHKKDMNWNAKQTEHLMVCMHIREAMNNTSALLTLLLCMQPDN